LIDCATQTTAKARDTMIPEDIASIIQKLEDPADQGMLIVNK
jgi:hypothetical protein